MLPPFHPGVAYLLYAPYTRLVHDETPTGVPTLALIVGSVLPDLVDMPLHYLAGAPSTRTVAHSAFTGVALSALVLLASYRLLGDSRPGEGFAVGYLSHLLADAVWPLVFWNPGELRYLGWPFTQQPPYEGVQPLVTVGEFTVTTVWVEAVLLAIAFVLWWRDGRPGLQYVRRR